MASINSTIKLSDGNTIPLFGLGAYSLYDQTYNAVLDSLRKGYRLIDTAQFYKNEAECGHAVRDFIAQGGASREEIFYTSKVWENKSREYSFKAVKDSLARAGLDYIDLYLLHGPVGGVDARLQAWLGLCDAKDAGLVRSIGISNWGIKQIQTLIDAKPKYLPVVNQIELSPFLVRKDLVDFDNEHGITNEAWAPLVRGEKFGNPVLQKLASKYNKSEAQILLRYALDKGYVVIPRSSKPERIHENADIYDFDVKSDLADLDALDEDYKVSWDPTTLP